MSQAYRVHRAALKSANAWLDLSADVKRLVLGAGDNPVPGAFNVDARQLPGIDLVTDLNEPTWPMPSDAFDVIVASHIIEHVRDRVAFLNECWRVGKDGGVFVVEVPAWNHVYGHSNLEHRSTWTHQSFDRSYVLGDRFAKMAVKYRLFSGRHVWVRWEWLGRQLAKHTGLVSGYRFTLSIQKIGVTT